MHEIIQTHIERSIAAKQELLEKEAGAIYECAKKIAGIFQNGGKLLLCGNGGSAADAQHIAAELMIRYKSANNRASLPAISLSTDSSVLTAGGNDLGFDSIYSRQIEGLGNPGDALLAITTSGNSQNIINALIAAKKKKMTTFFLTGRSGGKTLMESKEVVDMAIRIPADETAQIQECHIMIGHIFCSIIERELFQL